MPDETVSAPKKRRGRPPKKRHDPEAAPVNGDYTKDVVLGRESGKRYAWLTASGIDADVPNFKHRGYRKVERTPDGPRPAWDLGSETDSGFSVGGLELYEVDEDLAKRNDAQALRQSDMRMKAIHEAAKATGGYMTHDMERV